MLLKFHIACSFQPDYNERMHVTQREWDDVHPVFPIDSSVWPYKFLHSLRIESPTPWWGWDEDLFCSLIVSIFAQTPSVEWRLKIWKIRSLRWPYERLLACQACSQLSKQPPGGVVVVAVVVVGCGSKNREQKWDTTTRSKQYKWRNMSIFCWMSSFILKVSAQSFYLFHERPASHA